MTRMGAAIEALNELKPGLDEKLYENALVIELQRLGHKIDQQRSFPVKFKDIVVSIRAIRVIRG